MGLTNSSIGTNAVDCGLIIKKKSATDKVVALAGNPNVGKSTVFNSLTGMNQHTGNWPGKTVCSAQGYYSTEKQGYVLIDIPGTYSLLPHSAEEEVARNFICFGNSDAVVVVCDATCLERNLNLVLQTIEISKKVVVCVNLIDEAKRKGIHIDERLLSRKLGVPVVKSIARSKKSLSKLTDAVDNVVEGESQNSFSITYNKEIEEAISNLDDVIKNKVNGKIDSRWLSLRLLDCDDSLKSEIDSFFGKEFLEDEELLNAVNGEKVKLAKSGITQENFQDIIATSIVSAARK